MSTVGTPDWQTSLANALVSGIDRGIQSSIAIREANATAARAPAPAPAPVAAPSGASQLLGNPLVLVALGVGAFLIARRFMR